MWICMSRLAPKPSLLFLGADDMSFRKHCTVRLTFYALISVIEGHWKAKAWVFYTYKSILKKKLSRNLNKVIYNFKPKNSPKIKYQPETQKLLDVKSTLSSNLKMKNNLSRTPLIEWNSSTPKLIIFMDKICVN